MTNKEMQHRLVLWRDYFRYIRAGLDPDESDKHNELSVWLDILIHECESSRLHLWQDQPEFCQWERLPKDLSSNRINKEL